MSSPVDEEIAAYKAKINRHEAEIEQIKAHPKYKMFEEPYMGMIKSEKDGILACEAALQTLRQGQQGEFFSDASTRLSSSFRNLFLVFCKMNLPI